MLRKTRFLPTVLLLLASPATWPVAAETAAVAMPPLTGRWSGTVTEYRDGEITRRFPIEASFGKSGTATLTYPTLNCRGRLTFVQALQGTYAYKERRTRGRCLRGDAVLFLYKKDKLVIDWEHFGRPYRLIVSGPLSQVANAAR